jgi:hypothetical protein
MENCKAGMEEFLENSWPKLELPESPVGVFGQVRDSAGDQMTRPRFRSRTAFRIGKGADTRVAGLRQSRAVPHTISSCQRVGLSASGACTPARPHTGPPWPVRLDFPLKIDEESSMNLQELSPRVPQRDDNIESPISRALRMLRAQPCHAKVPSCPKTSRRADSACAQGLCTRDGILLWATPAVKTEPVLTRTTLWLLTAVYELRWSSVWLVDNGSTSRRRQPK